MSRPVHRSGSLSVQLWRGYSAAFGGPEISIWIFEHSVGIKFDGQKGGILSPPSELLTILLQALAYSVPR